DSSINYLDEAGVEENAAEVSQYVQTFLETDQRTIQVLPPSETLTFYFHKYGLPMSLFALSNLNADVVLLVVNTPEYTLERMMGLLRQYGTDFSAYDAPELVQTYPFVEIYEFQQRG